MSDEPVHGRLFVTSKGRYGVLLEQGERFVLRTPRERDLLVRKVAKEKYEPKLRKPTDEEKLEIARDVRSFVASIERAAKDSELKWPVFTQMQKACASAPVAGRAVRSGDIVWSDTRRGMLDDHGNVFDNLGVATSGSIYDLRHATAEEKAGLAALLKGYAILHRTTTFAREAELKFWRFVDDCLP